MNKPKGSFAKLMPSSPTAPQSLENKDDLTKLFQETQKQLMNRSIGQSTDQSTNQSIGQSTDKPTIGSPVYTSAIVDRPKAFYITQRLDKKLDEAVRYFQEVHGIKKADRSTVVNAILDDEENWTEQSLDQLVSRLISQLTSRLTSK